MYILELYQNNYSKDLVAFDSLEEGKEAIRKIGYFSLEEVFTALDRYISYSD